MDASRLLAVINDIEDEFLGGSSDELDILIRQYTVARDNPSQDNTPAIQDSLHALKAYLSDGIFADYPPSKLAILEAINGSQRVGPGLYERLTEILSVAGQTTAGIVTSLGELRTGLKEFQKACTSAKTGLQSLGLTPYVVQVGTFEAGILIPEQLVDRQLGALAKELETWNKIVRGFQELAGEDEREVAVASLSSGSFEVYLPLGILAASFLSKVIDKVLEWYRQILELRKLRLEMQNLGAPVSETNAYKKHEHDMLEEKIKELAAELIKESSAKLDNPRKHELETQVRISIKQVARFVDKGGIVEVYTEPPDEPNEPLGKPPVKSYQWQVENSWQNRARRDPHEEVKVFGKPDCQHLERSGSRSVA